MANKFTKEMEKDIISLFKEFENSKIATEKFNEKWGTNFVVRTLQQRYSNFQKGLEYGIEFTATDEERERLARAELRAKIEQKKVVIMKRDVHSISRQLASREMFLDAIRDAAGIDVKPIVRNKENKESDLIIDLVISDLQYKGDEQEWVNNIFNKLIGKVEMFNQAKNKIEFRIVFLGDDVEAAHAHPTGQSKENNTDTVTQTIQLSKLYANGIKEIYNAVDRSKHCVSLVFVPYSNHGMIGGVGKERYQHPMEDLGRIIFEWIKASIADKDIHVYEPNNDSFTVETNDTVYLHGHQGYVKSNRFNHIVGVKKDVMMGHLHHYEEKEEFKRVVYLMPTCRKDLVDYERLAGFNPIPQVTIVVRGKNSRRVERIKLGE